MHNPDAGRDGRRGTGARRATVPNAGSWWPLPRNKGPPSTGRKIWSLDFSQLGLKLPNTSLGTYPQIFKSPIEVLVGYRPWPRSNLAPGICSGQRSFHKLSGPSRGPGSRGRVSPRPRQALPHSAPEGGGCKPRGRPLAPPGMRAPKGRQTPLPLGALRVCSRTLPRPIPGRSRHQRIGGFLYISPTSRLTSRRTGGGVQRPHIGQREPPATRSAPPLEGPAVWYPCGLSRARGLPRSPVSPSHRGP